MKRLFLLLLPLAVSSCNYYNTDNLQANYQMMGVDVTVYGGNGGSGGSSAFDGAFSGGANYAPSRSDGAYWGEGGSNSNYTPYTPGSSTPYYMGTDDNGNYTRGGIGSYYGH